VCVCAGRHHYWAADPLRLGFSLYIYVPPSLSNTLTTTVLTWYHSRVSFQPHSRHPISALGPTTGFRSIAPGGSSFPPEGNSSPVAGPQPSQAGKPPGRHAAASSLALGTCWSLLSAPTCPSAGAHAPPSRHTPPSAALMAADVAPPLLGPPTPPPPWPRARPTSPI
jgi:hypothetical protein